MKEKHIYHEGEPYWNVTTVALAIVLGIVIGFGLGLVVSLFFK